MPDETFQRLRRRLALLIEENGGTRAGSVNEAWMPLGASEAGRIVSQLDKWEETLLRLAARSDDYSGPCIRAHVASALGMTTRQLEKKLCRT